MQEKNKIIYLQPTASIPSTEEIKPTKYIGIDCGEIDYPIGGYLSENLPIVQKLAEELKKHIPKEINLWCTGSSGAIMAAFIAQYLGEEYSIFISHIKKSGEKAHNGSTQFEIGYYNVVVDDFIATGDTILGILKYLEEKHLSSDLLCVSGTIYTKSFFSKFKTVIASRIKNHDY